MEVKKLQDYLAKVLACDVLFFPEELNALPFFVGKMFSFYSGELYSRKFFLAVSTERFFEQHSIQKLESMVSVFERKFPVPLIFVFDTLSRRERLMLIKRGLQFIVPGTQMFLPYLGIDFSERIKQARSPVSQKLRPAAQAVLIEQLIHDTLDGHTLTQVAEIMNYTAMGIHRAINQLKELGLCNTRHDGYRKTIFFDSDKNALWERAGKHLRSPVKKVVPLENDAVMSEEGWPFAGEYALSRHSGLASSRKCYAVHEATFRELIAKEKILPADSMNGGIADLQVWRYSLPRHKHGEATVDLLSLELSFLGTTDPRIRKALLDLKENRQW